MSVTFKRACLTTFLSPSEICQTQLVGSDIQYDKREALLQLLITKVRYYIHYITFYYIHYIILHYFYFLYIFLFEGAGYQICIVDHKYHRVVIPREIYKFVLVCFREGQGQGTLHSICQHCSAIAIFYQQDKIIQHLYCKNQIIEYRCCNALLKHAKNN